MQGASFATIKAKPKYKSVLKWFFEMLCLDFVLSYLLSMHEPQMWFCHKICFSILIHQNYMYYFSCYIELHWGLKLANCAFNFKLACLESNLVSIFKIITSSNMASWWKCLFVSINDMWLAQQDTHINVHNHGMNLQGS